MVTGPRSSTPKKGFLLSARKHPRSKLKSSCTTRKCANGVVIVCVTESFAPAAGLEGLFSPHDTRPRNLRVVVAATSVVCLTVWLARWRCRNCRYVFTDYPDFRTPL